VPQLKRLKGGYIQGTRGPTADVPTSKTDGKKRLREKSSKRGTCAPGPAFEMRKGKEKGCWL